MVLSMFMGIIILLFQFPVYPCLTHVLNCLMSKALSDKSYYFKNFQIYLLRCHECTAFISD